MKAWINNFVKAIAEIDPREAFNPYKDTCKVHDSVTSSKTRTRNLVAYLSAMTKMSPQKVFVGEALGYRGGRRTGIPFSSDDLLPMISSQLGIKLEKATTSMMRERTATIMWRELMNISPKQVPLMWNCYPFHPYKDVQLSNRKPRVREIREYLWILDEVLTNLEGGRIIAVGKTAYKILQNSGRDPVYVRHPSYGGSHTFKQHLQEIYFEH